MKNRTDRRMPNTSTPSYFPRPNSPQPELQLHIKEVVLHAFSPHKRYAAGDALKRELTALLSQSGMLAAFTECREVAYVDGGTFTVPASAPATRFGQEVARAIFGGLQR